MRVLIVEDDYYCRSMLHDMLRPIAECDIAVNGEEAVFAFKRALEAKKPYDLICLDLVMPEMDGHQTLKELRSMEREMEIHPMSEAKVIVTTVLDDDKETNDAFFLGGATSYLVKPIEEKKLMQELESLGLVEVAD